MMVNNLVSLFSLLPNNYKYVTLTLLLDAPVDRSGCTSGLPPSFFVKLLCQVVRGPGLCWTEAPALNHVCILWLSCSGI